MPTHSEPARTPEPRPAPTSADPEALREAEYRRLQAALLALVKHDHLADADRDASLRRITEAVARALGVARVGAWLFSPDRARLECLDLCLLESGGPRHADEHPVEAAQFPRYFAALEEDRIIDASDVRADPRTAELADYLVAHDLYSMMDAPIRLGGRVVGVLCHEHAGSPRRWTHDEASFAASAADVVALALEQWARRREEVERRAVERRLEAAQRLDSLGKLAGQIAHDFNNLLVAILGNASLALQQLPRDSAARARVTQIEVAARHAAEMTRQLLAYAGRGRASPEPCDLNALVGETEALLRASLPDGVRLERRLAALPLVVEADKSQLRQVVMNLIVNAAEATGDSGGLVEVATSEATLAAGEPAGAILAAEAAGRYAALEVRDDGIGIGKDALRRIFDPFFSTKPGGRGLGLSAVLGIVRSHGGALEVESEVGRGARFRIFLPVTRHAAPSSAAGPATPPGGTTPRPRASALVLVVDDEPEVREVTADMLTHLGYEVVTASEGAEALARLHELGERVAAVVLDGTMPGLSGPETLRALRVRRPFLPVVVMSGHARADLLGEAGSSPTVFLAKPFTVQLLSDALARVRAPGDAALRRR